MGSVGTAGLIAAWTLFVLFVMIMILRRRNKLSPYEDHSVLQEGDYADVWHEGTRNYYRAQIVRPLTPKELSNELDALDAR
jgi:hypothetical protein